MTPISGFKIGYFPDLSWNVNADPSYISVIEQRNVSFLGFKWTSEEMPKHYDLANSSSKALEELTSIAKPLKPGQSRNHAKWREDGQELHIKAKAYAAIYKSSPEIVKAAQNVTDITVQYIMQPTLRLLDNALDIGLKDADVRKAGGFYAPTISAA